MPPGNSKASDPAIPSVRPGDLLDSFQQALDAVMPLDGTEPVSPSRLDPFFATIIGTVIGCMLDVIQSGKFPFASASPSAAAQPAPVPPQPSDATTPSQESPTDLPLVSPAASPASEAQPSSLAPTAPPSPSNSLKYPKIPAIRYAAFSPPAGPH